MFVVKFGGVFEVWVDKWECDVRIVGFGLFEVKVFL